MNTASLCACQGLATTTTTTTPHVPLSRTSSSSLVRGNTCNAQFCCTFCRRAYWLAASCDPLGSASYAPACAKGGVVLSPAQGASAYWIMVLRGCLPVGERGRRDALEGGLRRQVGRERLAAQLLERAVEDGANHVVPRGARVPVARLLALVLGLAGGLAWRAGLAAPVGRCARATHPAEGRPGGVVAEERGGHPLPPARPIGSSRGPCPKGAKGQCRRRLPRHPPGKREAGRGGVEGEARVQRAAPPRPHDTPRRECEPPAAASSSSSSSSSESSFSHFAWKTRSSAYASSAVMPSGILRPVISR